MNTLYPFTRDATRSARKLVLSVISEHNTPLTVKEIFKAVVKKEADSAPQPTPPRASVAASGTQPQPPYPHNQIRSLQFLKTVVLPSLARTYDIQKVHSVQTLSQEEIERRLHAMTRTERKTHAASLAASVDVWRYQLRAEKPRVQEQVVSQPFGQEVGAGGDYSYLNKRRQRAREGKVRRDVHWLRLLERAREEGKTAVAEGEVATVS